MDHRHSHERSRPTRKSWLVALLAVLAIVGITTVLVTGFVVASGMELWVFAILLVTIIVTVVAIGD